LKTVLDVEFEHLTVRGPDGGVVESRRRPRDAFEELSPESPWDELHAAYFLSYAMWNCLTAPFLFTYPGIQGTRERALVLRG
jgi:hypothetical protein